MPRNNESSLLLFSVVDCDNFFVGMHFVFTSYRFNFSLEFVGNLDCLALFDSFRTLRSFKNPLVLHWNKWILSEQSYNLMLIHPFDANEY